MSAARLPEGEKATQVILPVALRLELKALAALNGRNLREEIRAALEEHLKRERKR